ncbi:MULTISPECIES: hypothetical protein [unclassified Kitasatospora]|uniref:hypothetical protein n=1 Tax=unclassified Kitasatospora TaxID=2633591 RepID=UPI00070AE7D9|nr:MULTISPECIES: hypothetical protein [unclassified Kitasatospora]KQV18422.1 hypothetical protein ASC99_04110 [Kitasatospora sp. Root107]KRB74410.1 hypothetical protein ASE03_18030 [Kitasatospora sp. Root187]
MSTDLPGPAMPAPPAAPAPAAPQAQGVAIAAALGAAIVAGLAYGFIAKAIEREIGWAVIGIAAAVTFTLGRLGGRGQALPVIGAALSVLGLFFGQIFTMALFGHQELGISVGDLLTSQLDLTIEVWKGERDIIDLLFYGFAVYFGYTYTTKFATS